MNYTENDPAYPSTDGTGLTKRELFAAMAMQACRSRNTGYSSWPELAIDAVEIADALLAELERTA